MRKKNILLSLLFMSMFASQIVMINKNEINNNRMVQLESQTSKVLAQYATKSKDRDKSVNALNEQIADIKKQDNMHSNQVNALQSKLNQFSSAGNFQ